MLPFSVVPFFEYVSMFPFSNPFLSADLLLDQSQNGFPCLTLTADADGQSLKQSGAILYLGGLFYAFGQRAVLYDLSDYLYQNQGWFSDAHATTVRTLCVLL